MKINRNKKWKNIWDQKYTKCKDYDLLHVQDGFDDLNYAEWQKLTHFFLSKIAIDSADDILEVGWLVAVPVYFPNKKILLLN